MGSRSKKRWRNRKRVCSLLVAMLILVQTLYVSGLSLPVWGANVTEADNQVTIQKENYTVEVALDGFRYGFYKPDGTVIADKHAQSGICFGAAGTDPSPAAASTWLGMDGDVASFEVVNEKQQKAQVKMHLYERYVKVEILPEAIQGGGGDTSETIGSLPKLTWEEAEEGWQVSPEQNTALFVKGTKGNGSATVKMLDIATANNYVMEADIMIPSGSRSVGVFAQYVPSDNKDSMGRDFNCFFVKPGKSGNVGLKNILSNVQLGGPSGYEIKAGVWYQLKMIVDGSKISTYINQDLIWEDVNNTSNKEGSCGLRVDQVDAYVDNVRVYDQEYVYYQNDFEGTTLEEVKSQFQSELGSEEMELATESTARPELNSYLELEGNRAASAVTGTREDVVQSVQFDIRFTDGDEETGNSLVFGWQDAQNYYGLGVLRSYPGKLVLYKVNAGAMTVIREESFDAAAGQNYQWKAEIQGNKITGFVDGVKVIDSAEDTETEVIKGKTGIYTTVSTAAVDEFSYTKAEGETITCNFNNGDLSQWEITEDLVRIGNASQGKVPTPYGGGSGSDDEEKVQKFVIDARVEGLDPLYGLGDYGAHNNSGGVRTTSNVAGTERTSKGSFTNMSDGKRFISNFTVAPQRGFAQVLFEEGEKRVSLNESQTMLGVLETPAVKTLYYFFGTMTEIYGDYKKIRNEEGYEDTKPHYEMFGLGWETFGSLGWNAYQSSVMETVKNYVDSGYNITWAVIGSGFWPGDRSGLEGTTTSFGMWDDTEDPNGRKDGLANPRFPDPDGLKQFFADNDIKLLLGLRNHFKLPSELGGKYDASVDGPYPLEGLEKDYYIKNEDGSLFTVAKAKYPTGGITRGNVGLVDGTNPDALEWYRQGAALWGVDGFKEDAMISQSTYHDGNWNLLLANMVNKDDSLMIVRNGAYSLPGDVLRINDANYGTSNGSFNNSPDRMPINLLSYAASGVSNVYPDIVGGTGGNINDRNFQKYVVRNAQMAALTPSISVGINVLKMNNEENKEAAFHAINWHSTYAPYIYDAALKSWESGYPVSMTPLYIAYPNDGNTYDMISSDKRQFEWLLGESILAAPLFGTDFLTAESRDVYLPEGTWIDYNSGEVLEGPMTIQAREYPIDEMPIYIGGKGVLVGEDMENKGNYFAEIFPVTEGESIYQYTFVDGETTSTFKNQNEGWSSATLKVTDTTADKDVDYTYNEKNRSIKFAYEAGHDYVLTGGKGTGAVVSASLTAEKTQVSVGQKLNLSVSAACDDGKKLSMEELDVKFISDQEDVISVEADGTLKIRQNGEASITAQVQKKGMDSQTPVISNAVKIQVIDPYATITGPMTLIQDDFETGNLNQWKDLQSDYEIIERNDSNCAHYKNTSPSARGTMLLNNGDWSDYSVEADITVDNPQAGKTAGLILRYQEYNSCYLFAYTHGTGLRYIKRNVTDGSVDVKSVAFTMESGRRYHFRAEAKENVFTLYVDDVKMMEVTDEAAKTPVITSGSGGLYASGMQAVFDNVKASRVINQVPFEIQGTVTCADQVQVSITQGEKQYQGIVWADEDGKWSYPVYYLENGEHKVEVTIPGQDRTGSVSAEINVLLEKSAVAPDRSALVEMIQNAEAVDGSKFTEETYCALQEKLSAAKAVLAGQASQVMLDEAVRELQAAIEALEEKQEPTPGPKPVETIFEDVHADDWFVGNVQYVYDQKYMTGMDAVHFGPSVNLCRAQFATILYRMEGCPEVVYDAKFPDVPEGTYYSDAVTWASSAEVGIINGYADGANAGKFGPADDINREQLVIMLYRYAQYKGLDVSQTSDMADFPDKDSVSEFAEEAFGWAVANGLIKGDQGRLNPQGSAARAQCAVIIQRFMENVAV